MRSRLIRSVVAGCLLAAALVSCASKSADQPDDAAGRAGTIHIGLEGPLSGDQRATGRGMLRGAQLAAAELNRAGGVLGKRVVVVPIDDAADPARGVAAAKRAIASGLDAVVGPYNSGVGLRTLPLYIEAGLVPLRLTSSDDTAGLGFTLQPMTSQIAPVATKALSGWLKAESVAIIFDSTQEYTKAAATSMERLLREAGITVTTSAPITPGESSYASVVQRVAATTPDVIYVDAYYPEAGRIAQQMFASKVPAKCLADYGAYDNEFINVAGVAAAQACP
ncbi:MAG: branched-chain amino acid ABC transporter substrate-binding protein, partial [Actinomycetes bacterium]